MQNLLWQAKQLFAKLLLMPTLLVTCCWWWLWRITEAGNRLDENKRNRKLKMFITIIFSAVKRMYWHSCCCYCKQCLQNFNRKYFFFRITVKNSDRLTNWLHFNSHHICWWMNGQTSWLTDCSLCHIPFLFVCQFVYLFAESPPDIRSLKMWKILSKSSTQGRQLWKWFQLHSHTCADRDSMIFSLAHSIEYSI